MTLLVVLALTLATQTTPAAEAKDKESSKKTSQPTKVYTNDDLRSARGNVAAPGVESQASASTPAQGEGSPGEDKESTKAEPTEEEKRDKLRSELQSKIDEQRDFIDRLRKDIDRAQTELNDASNLVYSLPGAEPTGRRALLTRRIDENQKQIQRAQETISGLEEQARRQGLRVQVP